MGDKVNDAKNPGRCDRCGMEFAIGDEVLDVRVVTRVYARLRPTTDRTDKMIHAWHARS